MTSPIEALETGLYNKLNVAAVTNIATGGVWNKIAPQGTALPYVIFQWQGGGDERLTPRRSRNMVYTVKALAALDSSIAESIDNQIEAALQGGPLSVAGWTNYVIEREQDVNYVEISEGVSIFHIGAQYRILLSA